MTEPMNNLALQPAASLTGTRVLCLGNDLLGDDSFGFLVAERLRRASFPGVEIVSTSESGLDLLDHILGARCLIVVDAIQTGNAPPGTIYEFHCGELSHFPGGSLHTIGLFETLELATRLALPVPPKIIIFAVEVVNSMTLGEAISPVVRAALPIVVSLIRNASASAT